MLAPPVLRTRKDNRVDGFVAAEAVTLVLANQGVSLIDEQHPARGFFDSDLCDACRCVLYL